MSADLTMPRLTESLQYRDRGACNRCGKAVEGLQIWQEHDDHDRAESRYVVLCKACADRVIEPHARLYRHTGENEPCPGVMAQCESCAHVAGLRCRHPQLRTNGGEGIAFAPPDSWVHLQMAGPRGRGRRGQTLRMWRTVPECPVREPERGGADA